MKLTPKISSGEDHWIASGSCPLGSPSPPPCFVCFFSDRTQSGIQREPRPRKFEHVRSSSFGEWWIPISTKFGLRPAAPREFHLVFVANVPKSLANEIWTNYLSNEIRLMRNEIWNIRPIPWNIFWTIDLSTIIKEKYCYQPNKYSKFMAIKILWSRTECRVSSLKFSFANQARIYLRAEQTSNLNTSYW